MWKRAWTENIKWVDRSCNREELILMLEMNTKMGFSNTGAGALRGSDFPVTIGIQEELAGSDARRL